jgi:hypothetical protein
VLTRERRRNNMSCNCNNKNIFTLGTVSCSSRGSLIDKSVSCDCDDEQLIVVKGVCPAIKLEDMLTLDTQTTWTQMFIPEVLCIPSQKPDIEQIQNISSVPEIFSQRVVKTPISGAVDDQGVFVPEPNQEGINSTGRKLVIEGMLRQKVVYTADLPQQSVHSAHFDVPFSAFIILPYDTPLTTKYKIETCIEDIFVCRVTARQIFKNVTLFIKATALVCPAP